MGALTPTLDSDLLELFKLYKRSPNAADEYANLLDILKLLAPVSDESRDLIEEMIGMVEQAAETEALYREENAAGAEADYRFEQRDAA